MVPLLYAILLTGLPVASMRELAFGERAPVRSDFVKSPKVTDFPVWQLTLLCLQHVEKLSQRHPA
jgi:hypothetical protein